MDRDLKIIMNDMESYLKIFQELIPWDNGSVRYIASLICSLSDKKPNKEEYLKIKELIYNKTPRFSPFRTTFFQPLLIVLLMVTEDPEKVLDDMIELVKSFKQVKITANPYLIASCYYIVTHLEDYNKDELVELFRDQFKTVKKEHKLLTGIEDYIYFAIFAMIGVQPNNLLNQLNDIMSRLNMTGMSANNVQAVAFAVLLLDSSSEDIVEKIKETYVKLKKNGYSSKDIISISNIVVLAELDNEDENVLIELRSIREQIRALSGFGTNEIDDRLRNEISIILLANEKGYSNLTFVQTLSMMVLASSCSSTNIQL